MKSQFAKRCGACDREFGAVAVFCPYDGQPLVTTPLEEPAGRQAASGLGPGRVIDDRYRIIEPIGNGGMGIVFRALHVEINRRVALKILSPEYISDPIALGRFRREARALGAINHPNAVSVMDFGVTEDGLAFLVMELLEGRTLRRAIGEGPITLHRAARILSQVCGAVAEAHRCGVIHRDLKPDNIMLVGPEGEGETAKVLDFGIAKLRTSNRLSGRLTAHDTVVGTPHYMAPEACERGEFTPSSDIYALGIILYEMLAGVAPFDGASALDVAVRQVNDPPPPFGMHRSDVPSGVEVVVMRALAKRPEDRQSTPVELADQFESEVRATEHHAGRVTSEIPRPVSLALPLAPTNPNVPAPAIPDAGARRRRFPRSVVVGILVASGVIGIALVLLVANALLAHPSAPPARREFTIDLPQQSAPDQGVPRLAAPHLRSLAQLL